MPTYEYACRDCGERLEAVQSFTDEPLTSCPNCGGDLRKVFGAVGIVFKGSGFYKTDNRSNGSRSSGSGEGSSSSSSSDGKAGSGSGDSSAASGTSKGESATASTPAKPNATTTSSST